MNRYTNVLRYSSISFGKPQATTNRTFWAWLDRIWNNYDADRVKLVGPERACVEWLLKNGARVRLKNWGTFVEDYNKIPPGSPDSFQIEEIYAENCKLMGIGFEYLKGLNSLKAIKLVNCELINDLALAKFAYTRKTLENVSLIFCPSVTDLGLTYLYLLKNLKHLNMNYLPNVKNKDLSVKLLKENLPNCNVEYVEEK